MYLFSSHLQVLLQIEEKLFAYLHQAVFREDNGRAVRTECQRSLTLIHLWHEVSTDLWSDTVSRNSLTNDSEVTRIAINLPVNWIFSPACYSWTLMLGCIFHVLTLPALLISCAFFPSAAEIWQRSCSLSWCHQGGRHHVSTQVVKLIITFWK